VQIEWSSIAPGVSRLQYLNMNIAANNLPEIFRWGECAKDTDSLKFALEKKAIYTFTKGMIQTYMPGYTATVKNKCLFSLDDIITTATTVTNGVLGYIPQSMWQKDVPPGYRPPNGFYGLYLRDDILKTISPKSKTEAEMKALLIRQGSLSMNDVIGDLPMNSLSSLYDYLVKVKALNLKVGTKPVIPGEFVANSDMPDSLWWSAHSAMGYMWNWPLVLGTPIEKSMWVQLEQPFKDWLAFNNKCYNAGLLDPEIFIMKTAQMDAKVINGEYAAFQNWMSVGAAGAIGKERGYGYRWFVFGWPLDQTLINNQTSIISCQVGSLLITKTLRKEDLPVIMNYVDYFTTDEFIDLIYWGSPDWYTGGKDYANRKYKPQYKAIEDYVLYGITSEKDGTYYHMATPNPLKTGGIKGTTGSDMLLSAPIYASYDTYNTPTTAPFWVLPKEGTKLKDINMYSLYSEVTNAELQKGVNKYYVLKGWGLGDAYTPEVAAFDNKWYGDPKYKTLLTKLATGPAADFEANWDAWIKHGEASGSAVLKKAVKILVDNWNDPAKTICLD